MKQRLVNFLKLLALVSLTAYLSSRGGLKAQKDSKAIKITEQEEKQTVIYRESHALVIWAGNYQHWGTLNNVEEESKQVVKALEQRGFQVTTVGNPTGLELERAIKDFIDNYGYEPDNRLVIFFSGHGHTRHRTKGYLVPVDAQDPTSRKNERDFLRVALPMQQIITWAKLIEAKHVLFVFDSCFSGTVFKQRSSTTPTKYILDVVGNPVRQFLTAGDADEEVPAKSVFTPLFIRALNGEADTINQDGYVTGNELGNYLRQNLREYDTQQTPQFGTIRDPELDQGDIVFRSLTKPISSDLPSQAPEITTSEDVSKSSPTDTPPVETPSLFQEESNIDNDNPFATSSESAPLVYIESSSDLAIRGTDPVAYFTEGEVVAGDSEYESEWQGATWRFSSAENQELFESDPEAYTPQYGGYCAKALSEGNVVSSDPEAWKIVDGKLYLNYSSQVQQQWLQDIEGNIALADEMYPDALVGATVFE